jgi:hypothetical protein
MIDGGRGADPPGKLDAWLVTDERAELISGIRRLAFARQLVARATSFRRGVLRIERCSVVHTSNPTWGYLIVWENKRVAWAPEFFRFPGWATSADLMFAEAAAWSRPIRFRGGVGGHLGTLAVADRRRAGGSGVWCSPISVARPSGPSIAVAPLPSESSRATARSSSCVGQICPDLRSYLGLERL